jgi:hypothetical protein
VALEVAELDCLNFRVRLTGDPRTELDYPVIADVDAVVVVRQRSKPLTDLEVVTGLEPSLHIFRLYGVLRRLGAPMARRCPRSEGPGVAEAPAFTELTRPCALS